MRKIQQVKEIEEAEQAQCNRVQDAGSYKNGKADGAESLAKRTPLPPPYFYVCADSRVVNI